MELNNFADKVWIKSQPANISEVSGKMKEYTRLVCISSIPNVS